jgi:hypothetical protein
MKKLILILSATLLTFTSCNKDDDSTTTEVDAFIGTWTNSKLLLNDVEQPIDDCDMQSAFTINSDGTFTESSYFTNSGGTCELDFEEPGTWENLGSNIYRITYDPDIDGDTYTEDITITNNTFSVFYDDPYIYVFTKN